MTYGYGNVYRPPPAIAQQQVRPRKMPVGDPPLPVRSPPAGWSSSRPDLRWPYAWVVPPPRQMPVGPAPVPFPLPLGIILTPLGRAVYGQRLPVIPPPLILGAPYPTPASWMQLHGAAFRRDWSIPILEQRPPKLGIGDPPVGFPFLGPWSPALRPDLSYPIVSLASFRLELMPVSDAPVAFPKLGSWPPGIMDPPHSLTQTAQVRPPKVAVGDPPAAFPLPFGLILSPLSRAVYQQRLPVLREPVILVGIPYPTPPTWMALHGPAFLRDWPLQAVEQRLRLAAVGPDPVPFPLPTGLVLSPLARSVYAQRRPVVLPVLVIEGIAYPMPWAVAALHGAAYLRVIPPEQQQVIRAVGGDPIPFPRLGAWLAGTMDPPATQIPTAQVRPPEMPIGAPPIPFPKLGLRLPGTMDPPRVVEQLQVRPPKAGIGDPPVAFGLSLGLVLQPLPRHPYHQKRPQLAQVVVFDALRVVDLSAGRYLLEDWSGGRWLCEDRGDGRYRLTDASGQRYDLVSRSGVRYPTEDES